MAIMAMLRAVRELVSNPDQYLEDRMEHPDPTPIEVTPDFVRPISSLEDLRQMMEVISREAEEQGLESFEQFYDFEEDADFDDIPAPAQLKHEAVLMARDRDFEKEVEEAKAKYRDEINAKARQSLKEELQREAAAKAAASEGTEED